MLQKPYNKYLSFTLKSATQRNLCRRKSEYSAQEQILSKVILYIKAHEFILKLYNRWVQISHYMLKIYIIFPIHLGLLDIKS